MNDSEVMQLCDVIREAAFALHTHLRHGHLEKVYENGLAHRLRKLKLNAIQQKSPNVYDDDGALLGEYIADLFVDDCLLVEIKAAEGIASQHLAQLLGYMRASNQRHGLLINFGAPKLQVRKLVL